MNGAFRADTPAVGIFWVVNMADTAQLLAAGSLLEAAERYGDFLTFPDGHSEIWDRWRKSRETDPALRTLLRMFEYEDWPRGRIVFDRLSKKFILYADRKLMRPETIAQIRTQFSLPKKQTVVTSDFHYQSRETPKTMS